MKKSTNTAAVITLSFCAGTFKDPLARMAPLTRRAVCFLALILSGVAAPVSADETAGQVQVIVGAAQLIDGMGKSRPMERGTEIRQGDRIVTGDGGLVQLKLTDGTYVSVKTNTDVAFEKYRYDEKSAQGSSLLLKLAQGALRSITGLIGSRSPDAYKVITPTATIGIRGTDHEPVYIPEPAAGEIPVAPPGTYDKVNSGATFIQTPGGMVEIRPGQVGFVPVLSTAPPRLLPAVPDFYKKLDGRDGGLSARDPKRALSEKGSLRAPLKPSGATVLDGRLSSPGVVDKAQVFDATIQPAATIAPTLSPATVSSTPLVPLTTTIAPSTTTLVPTATMIAPSTTLIAPTTTLIAPTTTVTPTTTLSPAISPTLAPLIIKKLP